jgi:hypothetical protein
LTLDIDSGSETTNVFEPTPLRDTLALRVGIGQRRARATPTGAISRNGLLAMVGIGLWVAACSVAVALLDPALHVDIIEQLVWVRAIEWGYYKHPPLTTILLWPWVQLLGIDPLATRVAGAFIVGCALWIYWHLLHDMFDSRVAWLATLGTMCVSCYPGAVARYNHDDVLLLAVAAFNASCWRAFSRRSMRAWLAVGATLGLGALAKYQMALMVIPLLVYWLQQHGWRRAAHRHGLAAALLLAAVVFSPHAVWLAQNGFPPFHYAMDSALAAGLSGLARLQAGAHWFVKALERLLPALLFAGLLVLRARRSPEAAERVHAATLETSDPRSSFLQWFVLLPLTAMPLLALITGSRLHWHWVVPFLGLAFALLLCRLERHGLRLKLGPGAIVCFALVQTLLVAALWIGGERAKSDVAASRGHRLPSPQAIAEIAALARPQLGGRIDVVAGPSAVAGAMALGLVERPRVLIDGRFDISPWVSAALVRNEGVLWIGLARDSLPTGTIGALGPEGFWWAVQRPVASATSARASQDGARPPTP